MVARVGIAVALIPLVLAGLAFAGVTVPGPARSAFDSVGITLPNQPAQKSASTQSGSSAQTTTTGNDVSSAAKSPAHRRRGGNSAAAHRHALEQHLKAHGRALGHDHGLATGLTGSSPPGHGSQTTGSSQPHPTHPAPPVHPSHGPPSGHSPGGNANGHSK